VAVSLHERGIAQAAAPCRKLPPEVYRHVGLLEELRALQRDLTNLGDSVAIGLLERAVCSFFLELAVFYGPCDALQKRGETT